MKPEDFEVILWDFDGVIINSNSLREKGFREVLNEYSKNEVEQLINFHNANGGWSRYVKFKYFFEEIRGEQIIDKKVNELAEQFSEIMKQILVNPDLLINETVEFIKRQHEAGKQMHIVSGSDGTELRWLCSSLNLDKYFVSINGSPTPKTKLVQEVINKSGLSASAFCLIGDAGNDYEAAKNNKVAFFGYNNPDLMYLTSAEYLNSFYNL